MKKFSKHKKGFTLVELLVVVAIIAILAGIGIPIMLRQIEKAKIVKTKELMNAIETAADDYFDDHNLLYLGNLADGESLNADVRYVTSSNEEVPLTDTTATSATASPNLGLYFEALLGERVGEEGILSNTEKVYLGVKDAVDNKYGIVRVGGSFRGIVDAWGCGMAVYIDLDDNEEVIIPSGTLDGDFSSPSSVDDRTIKNADRLNFISWGRDTTKGTGNTDDVSSW